MTTEIFSRSISDLGATGAHWQSKITPPDVLQYLPPMTGCWSVFRMTLQVPESLMLFVSPGGCARHSGVSGMLHGYHRRSYYLQVEDVDVVTGEYMEKIPEAVDEMLATARPRPKAVLIWATCIDDLLGSDYERLVCDLEGKHSIPFRVVHMDPTARDGKTPPLLTAQRAIYDFLERSSEKDPAVNIVGSFAPVDAESEFYGVMAQAGVSKVNHVAACATLDEFRLMSRARHNLLVRPDGRLAVQHMGKKLGIPFCFAPAAYGIETISSTYRRLEECLGVELSTDAYREEAEDAVRSYQRTLGNLSVAVGSTANAGAFELARALIEYGFSVRYVFANQFLDFDLEHIEWLKHHAPKLRVFTNTHPSMVNYLDRGLDVDLAIGFDAGYFCSGAKNAPLSPGTQPYGYRAVTRLFREMAQAVESPRRHREQMYASGMVT